MSAELKAAVRTALREEMGILVGTSEAAQRYFDAFLARLAPLQAPCVGKAGEPIETREPNPLWEAIADAAHAAIRTEVGADDPAQTLVMLKTWKADAEPAFENGKISFSRALLDSATDALDALLSAQPVLEGEAAERPNPDLLADRQTSGGAEC